MYHLATANLFMYLTYKLSLYKQGKALDTQGLILSEVAIIQERD